MESIRDLAQIVYYLALSITGPLALAAYLIERRSTRREREYKTYDELDNHFFEYQKLALEYYDLDILDVPNNDPSLAFDKKRKQEMVAYAILFSLFERAFLMFSEQDDAFRNRQWSGWKRFLNEFLRRENVRVAWKLSKSTYDTGFQAFMDKKVAAMESAPIMAVPATPASPPAPATAPATPPAANAMAAVEN
jgi:hypothetical protein